jgi:hypothetical protein
MGDFEKIITKITPSVFFVFRKVFTFEKKLKDMIETVIEERK